MVANIVTEETEKCRTFTFGCLHPWSAVFSLLLPTSRNGIYPDMPPKALNTRLSVLNVMHSEREVSSEQRSWHAPDRIVLEDWARDGHGCHVNMSGESYCILGRALWESQRSTFHGMCLPRRVQQSLGIPTPPCHLNTIEWAKWIGLVYDISFSKFPRNLVSSGYDFPLSTIF